MTAIDPTLADILKENGFILCRVLPTGDIAGIHQFMYTFGLCSGLDVHSYRERWCYEEIGDAALALAMWDGTGDPPGPWVKRKGRVEKHNPKLFDFVAYNGGGSEHWKRKAVVDHDALWAVGAEEALERLRRA